MASPKRKVVIITILAGVLIALVAFALTSTTDETSSNESFSFNPFRGSDPAPGDTTPTNDSAADGRTDAGPGAGGPDAAWRPRADSIQRGDGPTISQPPDEPTTIIRLPDGGVAEVPSDSPAALAAQAGDEGAALAAEARNGMGPSHWAAPISPEEEAEIQAAFDAIPPRDPKVTPRDRQASIEVARAVVEECFRELQVRDPGRRGRVAVSWTASADQGQGRIDDPRVTLNLKLREELFESCIVQRLDGLTFPAMDQGEPRRVEYPFFFDE